LQRIVQEDLIAEAELEKKPKKLVANQTVETGRDLGDKAFAGELCYMHNVRSDIANPCI
jgi:hypothetical protein